MQRWPQGTVPTRGLGPPPDPPREKNERRPQAILTSSSRDPDPRARLYEPPSQINPIQTGDSWDIVTDVTRSQCGGLQGPPRQAAAGAEPRQSARCPRCLGTPDESGGPAATKPATERPSLRHCPRHRLASFPIRKREMTRVPVPGHRRLPGRRQCEAPMHTAPGARAWVTARVP